MSNTPNEEALTDGQKRLAKMEEDREQGVTGHDILKQEDAIVAAQKQHDAIYNLELDPSRGEAVLAARKKAQEESLQQIDAQATALGDARDKFQKRFGEQAPTYKNER